MDGVCAKSSGWFHSNWNGKFFWYILNFIGAFGNDLTFSPFFRFHSIALACKKIPGKIRFFLLAETKNFCLKQVWFGNEMESLITDNKLSV